MKTSLKFVVAVLCFVIPLTSHASDLDKVVHAIERDFGVRHQHIPMLGFAMFVGRAASGFQMPGAKLAIFADQRLAQRSPEELQNSVKDALGPDWSPLVKSTLNHGNEQNLIFVRPDNQKLQMMIATIERGEVSLVEVKVSESQMEKWINDEDNRVKGHD